jgi:TetR/AcrR family transcriptional repressor of bet genes
LAKAALKEVTRRRTAPKEERQSQLIQATIYSVAENGLSDTTMATVAREAGLSQGIINLHFQSKDRLLVETLRYLSEQYQEAWERAMNNAGPDPAEQLGAMVAVDFKQPVCDRNKLAVWFAFWGESKSRPTYRKICAATDAAYRADLVRVCQQLIDQGGYRGIDAETVAAGLSAMTSGLWLDLLTSPRSMSRRRARQICKAYLASVFPGHFS